MKILLVFLLALFGTTFAHAQTRDLLIQKNGQVYTAESVPHTPHQNVLFETMSNDQRNAFKEKRVTILSSVAKVFNAGRLVIGAGALLKNSAVQFLSRNDLPQYNLLGLSGPTPIQEEDKGFIQFSHDSVQSLIDNFDDQMWDRPELVAGANEFSLVASVGVAGGAILNKKGFYPGLSLGVAIGYNKISGEFVFDLFLDVEKGKRAFPLVAQGGVITKLMVQGKNTNNDTVNSGDMFYPLGPFVTATSENAFAIGLGWATAFPPLLDSMYVYDTAYSRHKIFNGRVKGLETCSRFFERLSPSYRRLQESFRRFQE